MVKIYTLEAIAIVPMLFFVVWSVTRTVRVGQFRFSSLFFVLIVCVLCSRYDRVDRV